MTITDAEIEAVELAIYDRFKTRDKAIAAILASRAALAEAGLKIVAREPSKEMLDAGWDEDPAAGLPVDAVWRAMWDAAP